MKSRRNKQNPRRQPTAGELEKEIIAGVDAGFVKIKGEPPITAKDFLDSLSSEERSLVLSSMCERNGLRV